MGVSAQCPQIVPADQPGLAVESPIACAAVAGKASSLILLAIGTVGLAVERLQARRRALLRIAQDPLSLEERWELAGEQVADARRLLARRPRP